MEALEGQQQQQQQQQQQGTTTPSASTSSPSSSSSSSSSGGKAGEGEGMSWVERFGKDKLKHPYEYMLFLGQDARGDYLPTK